MENFDLIFDKLTDNPTPKFSFEEIQEFGELFNFLEKRKVFYKGELNDFVLLPKNGKDRLDPLPKKVLRRANGDFYVEFYDEFENLEQIDIPKEYCTSFIFDISEFLKLVCEKLTMNSEQFQTKEIGNLYFLGRRKSVSYFFLREPNEETEKQITKKTNSLVFVPSDQVQEKTNQLSFSEFIFWENGELKIEQEVIDEKIRQLKYLTENIPINEPRIILQATYPQILYFEKSGKIFEEAVEKVLFDEKENHMFNLIRSQSCNKNVGQVSFEKIRERVLQKNGEKYAEGTMGKNISNLKKKLKDSFPEKIFIWGDKNEGYKINPDFCNN